MRKRGRQRYIAFFGDATGFRPYDWQIRTALEGLPDLLPIPPGLGKTEGTVMAWAWRLLDAGLDEPLHLVYCLPMRSLVRQTVDRLTACFEALASRRGARRVPVYGLMGGETRARYEQDWVTLPDRPWVLVGTQDQLLSRALNRGYGVSRFDWPVHFGLLNHDCRWIVDEVQLMGPGLWTTSQLDWMRRRRFPSRRPCSTTWMSATLGAGFLATVDRVGDGLDVVTSFDPRLDKDKTAELQRRLGACRAVDWFRRSTGQRAGALHEQIARQAHAAHQPGTLTLVIANTVEMAQQIFASLPQDIPALLMTSRFRPRERSNAEQRLIEFEARRRRPRSGRLDGHPGLICVSTQVIEAGLDVSAHRMWSELAPWPSIIQRLGRLNRDGVDDEARATFWMTPKRNDEDGAGRIGPYTRESLQASAKLLDRLTKTSSKVPFRRAVELLERSEAALLEEVLRPAPTPLPRALDVHGLFSTEHDVHGGFTDVSAIVRGDDPDADVTVFWRDWPGPIPPRGDALDGPSFEPDEGCPVASYKLREMLLTHRSPAWVWNDETEKWERCAPGELRPGMVVMLQHAAGGYDVRLGWTSRSHDRVPEIVRAGPWQVLRDDTPTEGEYWVSLDSHHKDAGTEAESICDAVGLREGDVGSHHLRLAVVGGAGNHDLGKTSPPWYSAMPAEGVCNREPWAKYPRVLAVDATQTTAATTTAITDALAGLCPAAVLLCPKERGGGVTRLRWVVDRRFRRTDLHQILELKGVCWAGHEAFRPRMRHEAASALAMWHEYREGRASYPALAVYLVAAHHGKVRTVLRSISPAGDDVFGISARSGTLEFQGKRWPLDFSIAADGASGEWQNDRFVLTGPGWTGLVADLLGPWHDVAVDGGDVAVVPHDEPRHLGPFVLAWLETLVRVADWRASQRPTRCLKLSEVSRAK